MATLQRLFTEAPYALALINECLPTHCSNCFGNLDLLTLCGKYSCPGKCETVEYCGEPCMKADQPYHKNECAAFQQAKKNGSEIATRYTRLAGRIAGRLLSDGGETSLADGLPSYVRVRRLLGMSFEVSTNPWFHRMALNAEQRPNWKSTPPSSNAKYVSVRTFGAETRWSRSRAASARGKRCAWKVTRMPSTSS